MAVKPISWVLLWRQNGRDDVSNHQPHNCLLNCLFRRRSRKTSNLRVTGLCQGNSPVTGEFPAQRTSNAENVSIWSRHHGLSTPDIGRYPWPWPTTEIFPTSNPNPNRISWHISDIDHTSRWALGLISGGDTKATLFYFIVMGISAFCMAILTPWNTFVFGRCHRSYRYAAATPAKYECNMTFR